MPAQRFSQQRERIFEALCDSGLHPTAEMLYADLKPELPRLSLGTVYRNLQQMAEEGRIQKLDGAPVRFDAEISPHSHFCCLVCGQLLDLPAVPYDEALDKSVRTAGYQVRQHELLFSGICPACCGNTMDKTHGRS